MHGVGERMRSGQHGQAAEWVGSTYHVRARLVSISISAAAPAEAYVRARVPHVLSTL